MLIAGYAALIAAYSCNKENTEADIYLTKMEIEECENALRVPFSLSFSKECSYQVEYWKKGEPQSVSRTRIHPSSDNHVTVMFLYPATEYNYQFVIYDGGRTFRTKKASFITGRLPIGAPVFEVDGSYPSVEIPGYIMQFEAKSPGYVTFCDTDGDIVWYERMESAIRTAYFDMGSGTIAMDLGFKFGESSSFQRVAEKVVVMDLEGRRLIDKAASEETVAFPHHETVQMPGGRLLMLHNVARRFDMTSQGGSVEQEVYGEGFTIFSEGFHKEWSWDCFTELDPVRDTYLFDSGSFSDLIHANSVSWDDKGNFYFTANHLSELWKIDGTTGEVLYRVGPNGNMKMSEEDYADGLHASVPLAEDKVLCLDNGRGKGISRAVIYEMDTKAGTAKVTLSVPLPSSELSSRDRSNVTLSKDGKMLCFCSTQGRATVFEDLEGNVLKVLRRTQISYRAYYYETIDY